MLSQIIYIIVQFKSAKCDYKADIMRLILIYEDILIIKNQDFLKNYLETMCIVKSNIQIDLT